MLEDKQKADKFLREMEEAGRKGNYIIKALKKIYQLGMLFPVKKIPFKYEDIKYFSYLWKLL